MTFNYSEIYETIPKIVNENPIMSLDLIGVYTNSTKSGSIMKMEMMAILAFLTIYFC